MKALMILLVLLAGATLSGEVRASQPQWRVLGTTSLGTFQETDILDRRRGKYAVSHQWIATPKGRLIRGAPYGLECNPRGGYYCTFGFLVEPAQGQVFLITSGQIYRYDQQNDNFVLLKKPQYKRSPYRHVMSQYGQVVACVGGSSGAQLGGLLAYVRGTWKFISPPRGRDRMQLPTKLQNDERGIWMTLPGRPVPLFYNYATGRWQ